MAGALLDTHALYWAVSGERMLSANALSLIAESQAQARLFMSPISAWELSLASQKRLNAPHFGNLSLEEWLRLARKRISVRALSINQRIAIQAAAVGRDTGHKDPGDCYIVATARIKDMPVITRDAAILRIAETGYVKACAC